MTVILHAGMPKTATTSIQAMLALNRQRLHEAGVIYPELSESQFAGHWQLSAYWEPRQKGRLVTRRGDGGEDWVAAVKLSVQAAFVEARASGNAVLLSTEALGSPRSENGCAALLADIGRHDLPVRVIAYVRSPVDLCVSHVQQNIKVVRSKRIASPFDWVSNELDRAEMLIRVFGRDRVQLRFYRKGVDVVAEFMTWLAELLERPLPEMERAPNVNTSLSGPACAILALAKKARRKLKGQLDEKVAVLLRRNLTEFVPASAPQRLALPPAWTDTVIANNAETWNRLVDLVDATPEERQQAKYAVAAGHQPVTASKDAELDWLMSYYDEGFVAGLRAYSATRDGRTGDDICAMIDTLAQLRRELIAESPAAAPPLSMRARGT
jgi:hypothetical protein